MHADACKLVLVGLIPAAGAAASFARVRDLIEPHAVISEASAQPLEKSFYSF
jgi:hypothetical protein